jgi:hypothetical protein
MQLHSYINFLRDWMYLERYVNDGSDHKFKDQTEVPIQFQPRSKQDFIPIYRLLDPYKKDDATLPLDFYPVHPYTAEVYRELGHQVEVTPFKGIPTSSTRTVLISKDNFKHSYLVKLDLPLKISRFDRSVSKSDVTFSKQINEDIKSMGVNSSANVGTFLESGGGFAKLNNGKQVGYITRELDPMWLSTPPAGKFYLIPSFSLISHDFDHPDDPPLLIQMLKRTTNPSRLILDRIMFPLLDYWFALAERGLIWELQQQNTLFVIDDEKMPIGVVSRDYDGVYIDVKQRKRMSLPSHFIKHCIETPEELTMRYSLTFDHRVCKQNLVRMIECIAEYMDEALATTIKNELIDYIEKYLPLNVRTALPANVWYTCPEVMFNNELETITLPNPPLRK